MAFIHNLSVFINSNNVQKVLVCTFVFLQVNEETNSAVQLLTGSHLERHHGWAVHLWHPIVNWICQLFSFDTIWINCVQMDAAHTLHLLVALSSRCSQHLLLICRWRLRINLHTKDYDCFVLLVKHFRCLNYSTATAVSMLVLNINIPYYFCAAALEEGVRNGKPKGWGVKRRSLGSEEKGTGRGRESSWPTPTDICA